MEKEEPCPDIISAEGKLSYDPDRQKVEDVELLLNPSSEREKYSSVLSRMSLLRQILQ